MTDPLVQLSRINAVIVSKAEVENYPIIGKGSAQTGIIFVNRDKKSSRLETRNAIKSALRENKSVLIYPEGTTCTLPGTLDFKPGSFEIAEELGIPIVPVVIEYGSPEDYWGDDSLMSHFARKYSKPVTKAFLWIGEPLEGKTASELLRITRSRIEEKIRQIHSL
jgi:1-acyl-sn-glycerol-3-phosphate acyltransferase